MTVGPIEIYHERTKSVRGIWTCGDIQFKVYDLLAEGKTVSEEMVQLANGFLREQVVGKSEQMGDSNGLGFVVIHPGDLGVTIVAHWWAQGSVLCQSIYRHQYNDENPLDTVNRPAVACVWELEIISAEQEIWRETMMTSQPNSTAYLDTFAA